ncbi:hypothetical protein [Sulfurivirga sp.]|uniref:hypothetical protein n=1 Tax=Sulfurivirga sp. TaxID=2614236 RepID=UPI0025ED4637|nr:hypothetical protein [Sulfurivirga sp.]
MSFFRTLLFLLLPALTQAGGFSQSLNLHLRAGSPQPLDGETDHVRLRTLQWNFSASHRQVSLYGNLLYEHQITEPPEFDELQLGWRNKPWTLQAGRLYAAFGHYDTLLLNDPLPLYLGETRIEGVQGGWEDDTRQLVLFARPDWDGHGSRWGGSAGYTLPFGQAETTVHAGWISAMDASGVTAQGPAGWNAHVDINSSQWRLLAEGVAALEPLDGAYPATWQLEGEYSWQDWRAAVSWQGSRDAAPLGLPRQRWSAGLRHQFNRVATLAGEATLDRYAHRDATLFNLQLELHL